MLRRKKGMTLKLCPLIESLVMDKVIKTKRGLDQSLFRLRIKFTKISLLVMYHLTNFDGDFDANLFKPILDIINYSTSIFPLQPRRCGKEGEILQKFEYLENEKRFLDENKTFFIVFQGLLFGEKIKI